ncbi:MAG: lasso peptide biosynthesis protein [Ardenticatenaceae bacterium]|nr:lasso peptide biosynthesis protein [Ardenticatenaceae bacterium]
MSWQTRLNHVTLALSCVPALLRNGEQQALLAEMRQFCRQLPVVLEQPIPQAMAVLTPKDGGKRPLPSATITRNLADLAALWERQSPLGLCLRRSLIRYHYLRQLELPVVVQFGAKLAGQQKNIAGHAWLTLHNQPYYEAEENWRDFTVMFTWPER